MTSMNITKTILSFALMLMGLVSQCQTPNYKIPPLVKTGDVGFVSSELIYPLNDKPTAECHASTIVEISDGTMAAWFGGTEERHPDVGIWVSINKKGTWSHPVMVVD